MGNPDAINFNHIKKSTNQLAYWLANKAVSSKLDKLELSVGANTKEKGSWNELLNH